MKTEKQKQSQLMKHFSSVLRKHVNGEQMTGTPDEKLLSYLTRKELVEILRDKRPEPLPKDVDLIQSENNRLLQLIGSELHILAYFAKKWSNEFSQKQPAPSDEKKSESKSQKSGAKK